ncbi:RNase A-like domain-containing protein [Pantoea alhagi]|uniref:RNase A-like domain-containing protein n=1 Tax=Pantoea alhagi TaxID=1891675 RepID=UPI003AAA3D13
MRKHVAKTDEELLARLAQSPDLKAATIFESLQQAEKFISAGLRANRFKIIRWANFGTNKKDLVIIWDAGTKVGYGFRQGSKIKWPVNHVKIVLKLQEYRRMPYYIVTAYPELL